MSLSARIKAYLDDNGIKTSFLVENTGLSRIAVDGIVSGKRKITAEEFLCICDVLNVDPRIFKATA